MSESVTLERRLANFRAALDRGATPFDGRADPASRPPAALARRMAETLGGELVEDPLGAYVRVESPSLPLAVDRERLAALPGQPPADAPLVCLDTETTGLGSAAGTYAFLVGLGWWQADRFRTVQLLLPDQPGEPALLAALADLVPPDAWLVTYNGRGFDWPLLETRFRMARRGPPPHAGHLDLLPFVRRVFRHRLEDARLRTVEEVLLAVERHEDVEGWEIPGRYLDFLRTGEAAPLWAVARHNAEDVRSLARLLGLVEAHLGDDTVRRVADPGDVAGLARLYLRERRLDAALACLDAALAARAGPRRASEDPDDAWWSPAWPPDFGGAPGRRVAPGTAVPGPGGWTEERLLVERAHVLKRLGRVDDAEATWQDLATGSSRLAVIAAVELAKLREHRLRDLPGALEATRRAWRVLDRRKRLGRPEPRLEADLARRAVRLARRLARNAGRAREGEPVPGGEPAPAAADASRPPSLSRAAT